MKYIDIRGNQEILSIEIFPPELAGGYAYYYPDGIRRGLLRRRTYFVTKNLFDGIHNYYETPQEAIKGAEENLFVFTDGKIWTRGKVRVTFRSCPTCCLKYTTESELTEFLDNLSGRWGVDLGSLVCLETPLTISLYEHKSIGFKNLN